MTTPTPQPEAGKSVDEVLLDLIDSNKDWTYWFRKTKGNKEAVRSAITETKTAQAKNVPKTKAQLKQLLLSKAENFIPDTHPPSRYVVEAIPVEEINKMFGENL